MSWLKSFRAAGLAAAAVLALGGCFTPLYGPNVGGGVDVAAELSAIELAPLKEAPGLERSAHYLTQELKFVLGRGDPEPTAKRYRLSLGISQSLQSAIVDTTTGRATAATLIGTVTYELVEIPPPPLTPPAGRAPAKPQDDEKPKIVTAGTAVSSASYDRYPQRFATVRAARDAEIRVAKEIAEQIKTRLAASFAGRG